MKTKQLLFLFVCIFAYANTFAANRYWVGGTTGTWNSTTASWSDTPGGTAGDFVPAATDDVFFTSGGTVTVTLGTATPTLNSITFTSTNVTFAGAFAITTTNMTVTTSKVVFVDNVTVNSAITFSGTSPRITQNTTAYTKLFTMGNGDAFSLTGNSATNYFGGNTSSANTTYVFNTTSALTVYFDPSTVTPLTLGGLTVTRGSITLGNNVTTIRATLSATNSQELILAPNVTFTMATGGSSTLTTLPNGGVVNASASGSKVIVSTANPGFLDGTKRFFKTGSVINHFEFNSATKIFKLFESVRVRNITKTAGTIETTASKTITVEAYGSISGAGTITGSILGGDITYETATTRYWVGGATGNWLNATNWGTSSGNKSTPGIPEYNNDVVFDNSAGNANPTVTLTDNVSTVGSISFTSSNVTFAGAFTTTTNSMTANSSQVRFVDYVTVNSALTFSGTDPRITQASSTWGKHFKMGNGDAFTLTGNSPTNYFDGKLAGVTTGFLFDTSSALTAYFSPTTVFGGILVTKGLITLGSNFNAGRITLSATNNQELIVGENTTFTIAPGGTHSYTNTANGGVINASAAGSKVLITTAHASVMTTTGRIFKDATTINHLEYNSTAVFNLPYAMTIKNLTLTGGQINNTTNNITIPSDGNLVVGTGTTTAALNATSVPSVPTSVTATAGDGQASVAFTVPANGGSLISNYKYSLNDGTYVELSPAKTTSPIVITGLINTTAYTVKLKAVNAIGEGTGSDASGSVTPDDVLNDITVSTAKGASELALTPVSDVVVDKDAELTVNQLSNINSLTVVAGGKVTNTSTLTTPVLTLNSNAADGTATYLDNGTSNIATLNANQYLGTTRNWYVSSPVVSTASSTSNIAAYYEYIEAGNNNPAGQAANSSEFWKGYNPPHTMEAGKGYIALPSAPSAAISFSGTMNSGEISIPLTKTGTGYNLIGNPYPCHLTWTQAFVDAVTAPSGGTAPVTLIDPTIWIRTNSGSSNAGGWSFTTYNALVNESVPSWSNVIIAPMQAFWVKAKQAGNLILTSQLLKSHETSNRLKAPAAKKTDRQRVRLQVSNGTATDEALIYFDAAASDAYDRYDSPKYAEPSSVMQIFSTLGSEKLVINGMNSIVLDTPIPVGFVAGNATSFSLKANEISNLPNDVHVILKDNVTKAETDLTDGISTYQFSPEVNSDSRFSLVFRTLGIATGIDDETKLNAKVFVNAANQITIIAPEKVTYSIYNAVGQLVSNGKTTTDRTIENTIRQTGVYVVKLTENETELTTRLIIK